MKITPVKMSKIRKILRNQKMKKRFHWQGIDCKRYRDYCQKRQYHYFPFVSKNKIVLAISDSLSPLWKYAVGLEIRYVDSASGFLRADFTLFDQFTDINLN